MVYNNFWKGGAYPGYNPNNYHQDKPAPYYKAFSYGLGNVNYYHVDSSASDGGILPFIYHSGFFGNFGQHNNYGNYGSYRQSWGGPNQSHHSTYYGVGSHGNKGYNYNPNKFYNAQRNHPY